MILLIFQFGTRTRVKLFLNRLSVKMDISEVVFAKDFQRKVTEVYEGIIYNNLKTP